MPTRFDFTIGGVDVECRLGTLNIRETVNGRNRLTAEILSIDAAYRPAVGAEVVVEDTGTRVFGGNIATPSEHVIDDQLVEEFATSLDVVDFNAIADRITVIDGGFPPGFTVKQAATSLVGYLAPYGVTLHASQADGPTLPLMTYDIKRVSAWFDEISVITGWVWEIDYNKVLRFIEPGSVAAPFNIADDDGHTVGDIVVEPSDIEYANRVIVLGGEGQREVTEDLTFNGTDDFIDLTYELVGHRGYLTVNGIFETLGGSPAMWVFDPVVPNRIVREAGPPTAGVGEITYTAQFPYIAQADDVAEQAGPRGVVDAVIRKVDVFDASLAEALADGYLARLVAEPRRIRYSSFTAGLHPGQTQTIQSSVRNINLTALITDVQARDINGETMRYDVTAVEGDVYPGSWRDLYREWSTAGGGASSASSGAITIISSGGIGGSGTVGTIPKWTTTSSLGDSILRESAGKLTVQGTNGSDAFAMTTTAGAEVLAMRPNALGTGAIFELKSSAGTVLTTLRSDLTAASYINNGGNFGLGTSTPSTVNGLDLSAQRVLHVLGSGAARMAVTAAGGSAANLDLIDSSTAANQKWANLVSVGGSFSIRSLNDAGGVIATPISFDLPTGGNMTFAPSGNLTLNPGGNSVLPSSNYDINLGSLSTKYLTLHAAELWVETLVAQNTVATIGGRIIVAPTNTLIADMAPASTTLDVKYNNIADEDRLYLEADGKVEFMRVGTPPTAISGGYRYTVERNLDGSGANQWYAGDAVVNTGQTGNGFIDIYSVRGVKASTEAGPTIVGNVRLSGTYNDWAPRWAIGNLKGLYGYATDTYGVSMGDPSATNITIDATNGFRIRSGTTNKFHADISGNLSLTGDLSMSTSGVFRAGATAFSTGTGWWMDYNAGTPRFRIGVPSGNRLSWDGTNLTVVSSSVTIDANGITLGVPDTTLSSLYGYRIGTAMSGTNVNGLFGYESSGNRFLDLTNSTTATGGKEIHTRITAASDAIGVILDLFADGSTTYTQINSAFRPQANNTHTLGTSALRWSTVYGVNLDATGTILAPNIGSNTGTTLVHDASGFIKVNSSSERFKHNVRRNWKPAQGAAALLAVAPIEFDYVDGAADVVGFSAEELHAAGLSALVNYDADGTPYSIREHAMLAYLLIALQEQASDIATLKRQHG